jgi:hypothetical protein
MYSNGNKKLTFSNHNQRTVNNGIRHAAVQFTSPYWIRTQKADTFSIPGSHSDLAPSNHKSVLNCAQ